VPGNAARISQCGWSAVARFQDVVFQSKVYTTPGSSTWTSSTWTERARCKMPPRSNSLSLWAATKTQLIEKAAALIATAAVGAVAGGLLTWTWFKNAIALTSVVNCVAEVKTWLVQDDFVPQVFVTGRSGGLIVTELLIQELYEKREQPHPPIYVLYELPPDSRDKKYNQHGTKFESPSTKLQFFIPNALQNEDRNTKILIVNDWASSGNTLKATKEALERLKFTQVKTAVVAGGEKTLTRHLRPDHVCFEVEGPWNKLPWPTRNLSF
jgi:hypoxanthine phosphoribosyltransferase